MCFNLMCESFPKSRFVSRQFFSYLKERTELRKKLFESMECSSMVSVAAFGPGDSGTQFAVSNSNRKIEFHVYCKLVVL